jgi:sec-independent protein translocase protein TatA
MPSVGPLEVIILLVIVLLIFGPKRLPDLGRSLGRGMREFKDSVTGKDEEPAHIEEPRVVATAQPPPAPPVAAPVPAAPAVPADQDPAGPAASPKPADV